jgi:hypothetical protein
MLQSNNSVSKFHTLYFAFDFQFVNICKILLYTTLGASSIFPTHIFIIPLFELLYCVGLGVIVLFALRKPVVVVTYCP